MPSLRFAPAQLRLLVNIAAYVALALLPLFAMLTGWQGRILVGARAPAAPPVLGFEAIRHEQFQREADLWFQRHLGLAGSSIAADNTILYHLFGETKPGATVLVGRDKVLFIDDDIGFYNKRVEQMASPEYLDAMARRLVGLQRALARRGKALVPVVVPSKTSIYPDAVPPGWTAQRSTPRPADRLYAALIAALRANQVSFVDARHLLSSSTLPRAELFGPMSRHWSSYGACLVLAEVATRYAEMSGQPRPPLQCELEQRRVTRTSTYLDLRQLLNASYVKVASRTMPASRYPAPAPGPRPRVLMTGTSFLWEIAEQLEESRLWGQVHFDYYHNRLFALPSLDSVVLEVGDPRWFAAATDVDLYILDLFEGYIVGPGTYVDAYLDDAERLLLNDSRP